MTDLSLYILDIMQNSFTARAKLIKLGISIKDEHIIITVDDDGCGMSKEFLQNVVNPFTTTRTTRKVGMGIPLLKAAAEDAGGYFKITSSENVGTSLTAAFKIKHIDRPPLGDVALTLTTLIGGAGDSEILFCAKTDSQGYIFDTREIKQALGEDITDITTLSYLKEMIKENIERIFGGLSL